MGRRMAVPKLSKVDASEAKPGLRYFVVREGRLLRLMTRCPRNANGQEVLNGPLAHGKSPRRSACGAAVVQRSKSGPVLKLLPLAVAEELAIARRSLP